MNGNGINLSDLKELFVKYYGESHHEIRIFTAPGRVNLIGEHIDYCGGSVFPAALTLSCTAAVRLNGTDQIRLGADDLEDVYTFSLRDPQSGKRLKWGNYQAGVINALLEEGYLIRGMDFLFTGNIPFGSGLSSSAAIELTTAVAAAALSENYKEKGLDLIRMAQLGQLAEHTFCGVNCGIMDQFASAMGKRDHAILLDCASLHYKYVPLALGDYTLVLANTCKKHALGASEYNKRREEVAEGLRRLNAALGENRANLCDFSEAECAAAEARLGSDKVKDRVKHVIFENARVKRAVSALENGNLKAFGTILCEAHASIRDLYEVTGPELDTMFEIASHTDGCIGARMTGAGFGGCTVNIVLKESAEAFIRDVGRAYTQRTGIIPEFYLCTAGDGARELF